MFLKLIITLCSYAGKHCPAFEIPDKENKKFPFVWTPPNPRNKAIVFRTIFNVYTNTTYPVSICEKYISQNLIVFLEIFKGLESRHR